MLHVAITKLMHRQDLTKEETNIAGLELLCSSNLPQISAFLALLTAKGETVDEMLGLISAIRKHSIKIVLNFPVLDIVGTGGDGAQTLNVSTASSLLVAALGIPVLKHGNRAISSKCGAADVLEALGYPINLSVADITKTLNRDNFAFCFAPNYNPSLSHVRDIRRNLGFTTVFNLLGPLLHPASLDYMLIGVYDKNKLSLMANCLSRLGTKCSLVFHGSKLDELSCLGDIDAYLIRGDIVEPILIQPSVLGLNKCTLEDLRGEDAIYNAQVITRTLNGEKTALTDTLILNAAVALFVFGRVSSIKDGIHLAQNRLKEGNIIKRSMLNEIIWRKIPPRIRHKSFKLALQSRCPGTVISEIKRASPSAGKISIINDVAARARLYVSLGASVVSVLTDDSFDGSISDLVEVAKCLKDTSVPVLRKDFILYPEQIAQSKANGADAILLMVSVLGNKTRQMVEIAHAFGLETLVEVHNTNELSIALKSNSDAIGVNQRDLHDFSMHPHVFSQLIDKFPSGVISVAESGIRTVEEAKMLFNLGYRAILVGEALSRLEQPNIFFNQLYGNG